MKASVLEQEGLTLDARLPEAVITAASFSEVSRRTFAGLRPRDWAALSVYLCIALFTVAFHETWVDEAQAWLIARDLSLSKVITQTAYEGTPPLWHVLLWTLIRLHVPFSCLSIISTTMMTGAMYLWLRYSPFPAVLRLMFPFTFYMQYQYAVVSRSYCLTVLFTFATAAIWKARKGDFLAVAPVLALLCQTNLYGFVLAGSATAVFLFELAQRYFNRPPAWRERGRIWIGVIVVAGSVAVAMRLSAAPPDLAFPGTLPISMFPKDIWYVVVRIRAALALSQTFGSLILVTILILTLSSWFAIQKRRICVLPFLAILLACAGLYFKPWHLGMLVVACVFSLWLAWPQPRQTQPLIWTRALVLTLALVFGIHISWAATSIWNDVHEPYSGAPAAAKYLKTVPTNIPLYAMGYPSISVLPYFDRNIFWNQNQRHSYWAWSVMDQAEGQLFAGTLRGPAIVLYPWLDTPEIRKVRLLEQRELRLSHRFCGKLFTRTSYSELSCFDIYEKD